MAITHRSVAELRFLMLGAGGPDDLALAEAPPATITTRLEVFHHLLERIVILDLAGLGFLEPEGTPDVQPYLLLRFFVVRRVVLQQLSRERVREHGA